MTYAKKQKGFTIIEILLLVAIIGLLTSIVLTNFGTIKIRAQRNAVLTEINSLRSAIEGDCVLETSELFCGGGGGVSSNVCAAASGAGSQPVSGTSICGRSQSGVTQRSENTWPNLEKNRYRYADYASSDARNGIYAFSLFRDNDNSGDADGGIIVCCTHVGCNEGSMTPSECRSSVNL